MKMTAYEAHHNLYSTNGRGIRWVGHVACVVDRTKYTIFVDRPEEKGPLGKPRLRWNDIITMDHKGAGCGNVNWGQVVLV